MVHRSDLSVYPVSVAQRSPCLAGRSLAPDRQGRFAAPVRDLRWSAGSRAPFRLDPGRSGTASTWTDWSQRARCTRRAWPPFGGPRRTVGGTALTTPGHGDRAGGLPSGVRWTV